MKPTEVPKGPWFHAIDFRPHLDFVSRGRFAASVPPNHTLFGLYELLKHVDVAGADCLDIGTMDGIASFIVRARGASSVLATDVAARETFAFANRTLGLDVDYRTDIDLSNIVDRLADRRFDVVLMCGVLYHVFDPLQAVGTLRRLTRLNGLALVETHYLADEPRPIMLFNPGDDEPITTENFFWRASASCLEAMFRLCCFQVLAKVDTGRRITYLLRAARPSAMTEANAQTRKIHKRFMTLAHYRENIDFTWLEADEDMAAERILPGLKDLQTINIRTYVPSVPFQPKWQAPPPREEPKPVKKRPLWASWRRG
jgi:SAM-dependent methyltransferase